MAINTREILQDIKVDSDGRMHIFEVLEFWDGVPGIGNLLGVGPRKGRTIEVGDVVPGNEDALVRDLIDGKLHTPQRVAGKRPPSNRP